MSPAILSDGATFKRRIRLGALAGGGGALPTGFNRSDHSAGAIIHASFPWDDFSDADMATPAATKSRMQAVTHGYFPAGGGDAAPANASAAMDSRHIWVRDNDGPLKREWLLSQGSWAEGGPETIQQLLSISGVEDLWWWQVMRLAGAAGQAHQDPPVPTAVGAAILDEFNKDHTDYQGSFGAFTNTAGHRFSLHFGANNNSTPAALYAVASAGNGTLTVTPDPGWTVDEHVGAAVMCFANGYDPGTSLPPAAQGDEADYLRAHVIMGGGSKEGQHLEGNTNGSPISVTSNTSDTLNWNTTPGFRDASGATHVALYGWYPAASWKHMAIEYAGGAGSGSYRYSWANEFSWAGGITGNHFQGGDVFNNWNPNNVNGALTNVQNLGGNTSTSPGGGSYLEDIQVTSDLYLLAMHPVTIDSATGFWDRFVRRLTVNGVWGPQDWLWNRQDVENATGVSSFTDVGILNRNSAGDCDQYFGVAQFAALKGGKETGGVGDPLSVYADVGLPTTYPYGAPGDPTL